MRGGVADYLDSDNDRKPKREEEMNAKIIAERLRRLAKYEIPSQPFTSRGGTVIQGTFWKPIKKEAGNLKERRLPGHTHKRILITRHT